MIKRYKITWTMRMVTTKKIEETITADDSIIKDLASRARFEYEVIP